MVHPHHRAKGGGVDMAEEAHEEEEDAEKPGEEAHGATEKKEMKTGEELKRGGRTKRARGGHIPEHEMHEHMLKDHHKRKRGGKVPGKMPKSRPDRRARGGGTSDLHPTTAAGNMTSPSYEAKQPYDNGGGSMGKDMSPYRGGGHRRPG